MPTFDNQDIYNKHQSACECDGDCSCQKDDCGCCPPGLVAVRDCNGDISCLTPNDAVCHEVGKHIPAEGYVKLYHPVTGQYLGDVTPQDALTYIATIDPDVQAPVAGNDFNITTGSSTNVNAPAPATVEVGAVDFRVDRIDCDQPIVISLVGAPAGFSFIGAAASINIPEGESVLSNGIEITDVVGAGAYNLTVMYSGCSISKTKILTVNVS
jgi:hypothetical protein